MIQTAQKVRQRCQIHQQNGEENRYAQCVHASTLIPLDAPQCGFILVKTSIEDFLQITMVTNIGILIIIDKVRSHSQNQIQALHGVNMFVRIKLT